MHLWDRGSTDCYPGAQFHTSINPPVVSLHSSADNLADWLSPRQDALNSAVSEAVGDQRSGDYWPSDEGT
jgi:hypothetical protein